MHFVFTAPRYHTNQHFAMKALLDAGHEVSFLALKRGHSEVYDALDPTILGDIKCQPYVSTPAQEYAAIAQLCEGLCGN